MSKQIPYKVQNILNRVAYSLSEYPTINYKRISLGVYEFWARGNNILPPEKIGNVHKINVNPNLF